MIQWSRNEREIYSWKSFQIAINEIFLMQQFFFVPSFEDIVRTSFSNNFTENPYINQEIFIKKLLNLIIIY